MPFSNIFRGFPQIVAVTDKSLQDIYTLYIKLVPQDPEFRDIVKSSFAWYTGYEKEYQNHIKIISKNLPYIRQECFKTDRSTEICIERNLLISLIKALPCLPFEEKKEADKIIHRCLRFGKAFDRIKDSLTDVCKILVNYYAHEDLVGLASPILQKLLNNENILQRFLSEWNNVNLLLLYMKDPDFDLLANSSSTLCQVLTATSPIVDEFFSKNFDDFFDGMMQSIVQTEHKLIRSWLLKILYKILTFRRNMKVLVRFVSSDKYLRVIMNCLLENSPNVYASALEVFSLFLFCPKKDDTVSSILCRNRDRLIGHFSKRGHSNEQSNDLRLKLLQVLDSM